MTRCVSLFRGINVGGNQIVRMDALKGLHMSLGLRDVQTYIQSGNVVFTSDSADVAQIQKSIEDGFAQSFDFSVKVMVRTASQLNAIIENNPFHAQPLRETNRILTMFLESYQKSYNGPEEIHIIGQEAFIYYPEGMGRSKLTTALLEKKMRTAGTARNWNTVLKLQKMMEG